MMAHYNQWMNARLFTALTELSAAELESDDGAFFGSIMRTLNHIIDRDIRWLGWFDGGVAETDRAAESIFENFDALSEARARVDQEIIDWASVVESQWFSNTLNRQGRPATANALWAIQMFNHQTNHRAQVLTLLSQRGIDIGATDLPAMPGVTKFF